MLLFLALALQEAGPSFPDLAGQGRWAELTELAEARLAADPRDAEARYWQGRQCLVQAESLLAGGRLGSSLALSLLDRSVELLDPSAGQDGPGDGRIWWLEARVLRWRLRDRDPAEASADGGILGDLELAWSEERMAAAAHHRGLIAWEAGEPDHIAWLERAAGTEPASARFCLPLAQALADAGRTDEALAAFDRAAGAGDAWLDDLLPVLGALLPARRDAGRRLERLDALATRRAWSADALLGWHRAHAFQQLGESDRALAAFEQGVERRTDEIERAHASHLAAAGHRAAAFARLLPLSRARDWTAFEQAIGIAASMAERRDFGAARDAFDDLIEIEPRHDALLWNRALALWKSGSDEESERAFDALLARLPGRADALNDAALAAWGAGDTGRARGLLEQAAALPGSRDAAENLARLLLETGDVDVDRIAELLDGVLAVEPARARAIVLRHALRVGN